MKTQVIIAGIWVIAAAACSPSGTRSAISGNITGAEGKTIYLERMVNNQQVRTDSAVVQADGHFSIVPSPPLELNFYRLLVDNEHYAVLITDSTESLVINAELEKMKAGPEVSGSAHTEKLVALYGELSGFHDKLNEMRSKMNTASNEAEAAQLKADYTNVQREKNDYCKKWLESGVNSPAALAAVSELDMRTELTEYKKVIETLAPSFGHSMYYKDVAMRVSNQEKANASPLPGSANAPSASAQDIQKQMQEQMAKQQQQQQQMASGMPGPGSIAPEIADKSPDGKTYKLSDLKGKVVLVDFWASWCGPCRKENPYVLAAYKKYHKDGFEVFSVSLDNNVDRWKQAIQQDALPWPYHVSDLKGWSSGHAASYGVRSIPSPFLVGKDGKVINMGPAVRGPGLDNELKKLFGH